jgi:hypothetical protein
LAVDDLPAGHVGEEAELIRALSRELGCGATRAAVRAAWNARCRVRFAKRDGLEDLRYGEIDDCYRDD